MDILEFALEMKFADFKALYQKFFSITQSGERSKSDWWARERLNLLKRHGFLVTRRISFAGLSYFQATELARVALSNMRSHRAYVRSLDGIDMHTFEHDRSVVEARVALEILGRAHNWHSERRLKAEQSLTMGLPRAYQPDAVYWNKLKEPVAFELEISRKTKRLYENKIRKYVDLIRQSEVNGLGFRAVLFVVTHDAIFEVLSELTRRFEGKFRIEKFNDLLAQAAKEREVT